MWLERDSKRQALWPQCHWRHFGDYLAKVTFSFFHAMYLSVSYANIDSHHPSVWLFHFTLHINVPYCCALVSRRLSKMNVPLLLTLMSKRCAEHSGFTEQHLTKAINRNKVKPVNVKAVISGQLLSHVNLLVYSLTSSALSDWKSRFPLLNLKLHKAPCLFPYPLSLPLSPSLWKKKTWTVSPQRSQRAELSLFLLRLPLPPSLEVSSICVCARMKVCAALFAPTDVTNTHAHSTSP